MNRIFDIFARGGLAVLIFALALAACKTPPTEEMNNAQDAVTRAENDADAVTYAGNTLVRARDALIRMQSEADTKRYDAAKSFAAEAISLAEKAMSDGKAGAERARAEAANLINSLQGPLSETSAALTAAKQIENISLDFAGLDADMYAARNTYDAARQSLDDKNYQDVTARCQDVRAALADINGNLTAAAQTTSRKQ